MKVVYEAALFPAVGGGPQHFVGLSDALLATGVGVTHVLPSPSAVKPGAVAVDTVRLGSPGGRLSRQLIYELRRIALVLRWWITGRRFDVWMARHSLFGFGLPFCRLVARHVVLEVNGPIREEMLANFGSRHAAALADRLLTVQARAAHLVVAVSPGLAQYVASGPPTPSVQLFPTVPTPRSQAAREPALDRKASLLFVGALTPWYELDVTLDAIGHLRNEGLDLPLRILGEGGRLEALRSQADRLGIEDLVTFVGWVDPLVVREEMQAAGVGLLPLRPKRDDLQAVGSPLKLYEYVATGLRVVGTDVDGIANAPVADVVHVYRPGDAEACAAAIRAALDHETGDDAAEEDLWSWTARARELVHHIETLDKVEGS